MPRRDQNQAPNSSANPPAMPPVTNGDGSRFSSKSTPGASTAADLLTDACAAALFCPSPTDFAGAEGAGIAFTGAGGSFCASLGKAAGKGVAADGGVIVDVAAGSAFVGATAGGVAATGIAAVGVDFVAAAAIGAVGATVEAACFN